MCNKKTGYLYLQRAFSLIELIVVIAIIAIIFSIAIPNYEKYLKKAKVTQMIAMVDPCQTSVYQSYVANGVFPDSIVCQGVSLNNGDASFSIIPSSTPTSRISVIYSIIDESQTLLLRRTARFTVRHSDVTENYNICRLFIDVIESLSPNGSDLSYSCTVDVGCPSIPANCIS